jgi:plasmid stabilization system protein ParE
MTKPLSPAAQAVRDAAFHSVAHDKAHTLEARVAAALRAVADEVAPETPYSEPDDPDMLKGIWDERRTIRAELLAIAAELEGAE